MGKLLLVVALCACTAFGQRATGTLRGQVSDELGGVIVGASVVLVDATGAQKTATTNQDGNYVIGGLAPGKYTLRVNASGFAPFESPDVDVASGRGEPVNVTLKVTIEQQKVTVNSDNAGLSTEPENNTGAVILKGGDIEALPDDPDDLEAALQALAGPSAGPNGGQIFIDGFTGGRLPPKASIREIRINSNPFSAEYDRMGFGRIEILTRPGTDKFRGSASFSFNDNNLNSRNPFAPDRPAYQSRQYGGNLSGPISKKKSSFFIDFEKRDIDDIALINATILDANSNFLGIRESFPTPSRRVNFSPRLDYQINPNNTLVARYRYSHSSGIGGVGGFQLDSRAYDVTNSEQNVQLTETAVINKKIVNETRLQIEHEVSNSNANNSIPTINVQDGFIGGGPQVGLATNTQNHIELANNTSVVLGNHALKFGGRLRHVHIDDLSPANFGGTWVFSGGLVPQLDANNNIVTNAAGQPVPVLTPLTSIERYQLTERLLKLGFTGAELRKRGGGPTQLSLASGNPDAVVSQFDFGGYVQDDWKLRPNLTVNLGLRYENQDNISSNLNFAPRLGFAWAPGAVGGKQSKTVVRGGFGIFYDRVGENLTLTAARLNGVSEKQFIVSQASLFDRNGIYVGPPLNAFPSSPLDAFNQAEPAIPAAASIGVLQAFATPVSIYQLAGNIRSPYTTQSVISLEHQLTPKLKLAASYINARTLHLLRTRAINAPLPGDPRLTPSTMRPLGTINNVFEYESSGRFNQNQFIVNVSATLTRSSSLNAFYVLGRANSDTDGTGSFPADSYDLSTEYGRSSLDIRHRFVLFGNFRAPWGISLNPFVIVTSGRPFNIIIGRDLNGDTLFTERPAFATDLSKPGVVVTRWGTFDPNPTLGEQIIPRNLGTGPGSLTTNLRISKTFGFGKETAPTNGQGARRGGQGGQAGGGQRSGAIPMGGMGGMGGARGGGGERGGGGGFGGSESGKHYNLTVALNFQNLLNHSNLGSPSGNLSSSFFGMSTATAGNFGGFGGGGGACQGACNRKVEASVRFSF